MYTDRLVAFVDILGFKSLIERTTKEPALTTSVAAMLHSLHPRSTEVESIVSINHALIPEGNRAQFEEDMARLSKNVALQLDIRLAYFPDCISVSAPIENEAACFTVFELLAKIYVRIFDEYALFIRGGLTIGKLVHENDGPIFGPAFIRAYDIESKEAIFPRILLDSTVSSCLSGTTAHRHMLNLFETEGKQTYISLGSSFRFLSTNSSLTLILGGNVRERYTSAVSKAKKLAVEYEATKLKEKYQWALNDLVSVQAQMGAP